MRQTNQWRKLPGARLAAAAGGIAALALFGILSGTAAQAQTVYGVTNTGNFGILDLSNGNYQNLTTYNLSSPTGPTGGSLLTGLAFNQNNGNVFAIDDTSGLYQINTSNGTFGIASQLQYASINATGQRVRSIAFDQSGTLFGLASDVGTGANARLYTLNTISGTASLVQNLNFSSLGGLAILNSTGYATQGTAGGALNGPVFQFGLTGAGGAAPLGGQAAAGFFNSVSAFTSVQGQLKAVDIGRGGVGNTYTVNQNTGLAVPQATYNAAATGSFLGITNGAPAIAVTAPEPGTLGLLGMGLTVGAGKVLARRRRKSKPA